MKNLIKNLREDLIIQPLDTKTDKEDKTVPVTVMPNMSAAKTDAPLANPISNPQDTPPPLDVSKDIAKIKLLIGKSRLDLAEYVKDCMEQLGSIEDVKEAQVLSKIMGELELYVEPKASTAVPVQVLIQNFISSNTTRL